MKLLAFATFEAGPAWIDERLARPDRAPLAPVDGFEFDRPRSIAAAWGHIGHLIDTGDVPTAGERDQHVWAFMARMHGLGVGMHQGHSLYDEFLQRSGGAAPDGWPTDPKTWDKCDRIWNRGGATNPLGSELLPLALAEVVAKIAPAEDDRLPVDRLWDIEDLVRRPPVRYWDDERLFPRVSGGCVGVWFGRFGHHKTNFMLSKLRLLLTTTDAKVLYLMGEGIGGMGARLAAQIDYADRAMIEFRGRFKAFRVPHMADQGEINATLALAAAEGFAPDVVVVDTLATAISGLDEDNRTAGMLNSNGPIGGIARDLGCLLILIGHEGEKAGKLRGGYGFYGNVDYVVYIKANADAHAVALVATTGAGGKARDDGPLTVYYAIEYHRGIPIPVPTSAAGYGLLTGDVKWEGDGASSRIAGALGRLGGVPVSTYSLVMELYPPGDMDREDWQARCTTLARKLDRAARDAGSPLGHLFSTGEGGSLVWSAAPVSDQQ